MRESRVIYCYSDDLTFIGKYESINTAASTLNTPKTSIVKAIDSRIFDDVNKTYKSKRIYSEYLKKEIFFRTKPIKKSDK